MVTNSLFFKAVHLAQWVGFLIWTSIFLEPVVAQEYTIRPEEEADIFNQIENLQAMANNPLDVIRLSNRLLSLEEFESCKLLSKYIESRDIGRAPRILYLIPILYPIEIQTAELPFGFAEAQPMRWVYECSKIVVVDDIPFTTHAALPTNNEPEKDKLMKLITWCERHGIRRTQRLVPADNPFDVVDELDRERDFKHYTLGYRTDEQRLDEHASFRCQARLMVGELLPKTYWTPSCIRAPDIFRNPQHIEWQRLSRFGEMIVWDGRGYSLSDEAFDLLTRKKE